MKNFKWKEYWVFGQIPVFKPFRVGFFKIGAIWGQIYEIVPFRVKFENCGHFGSNFRIAVIYGQYLGHSRSNVIILKKSTKFDCKTTANSISTYNSSEKSNSTDRTYSVSLNSNSKTKSEKSSERSASLKSASKKSHYDTTVISKSLDRSQPGSKESIRSSLKKSTSKVSEIVKVGKYIDKKSCKNSTN